MAPSDDNCAHVPGNRLHRPQATRYPPPGRVPSLQVCTPPRPDPPPPIWAAATTELGAQASTPPQPAQPALGGEVPRLWNDRH